MIDGLGRLVRVDEPNSSNNSLGTTDAPAQPTLYTYDALSDLTQVIQGGQTRTFQYSSLLRLTSVVNPEVCNSQGTPVPVAYEYDDNGNLKKKTDARGIQTSYTYDELDRIKLRNYSDSTPDVTYTYDAAGVTFSKGRLTSVSSSASIYNYGSYDALGRVKTSSQKTDGQTYAMSYEYDRAGNLTQQTYPSGRVVQTVYNQAGRVSQVTGQMPTDTMAKPYASQFYYASHGAVSKMKLGNGLWEHALFNSRLQPTEIGLGLSGSDSSQLKLSYNYGTTSNNGDLISQTIAVAAIANIRPLLSVKQSYTYDELNRLETAQEVTTANNTQTWKQTLNYDQYGNRTINATQTTASMVGLNPSISTANNRINKTGYSYDFAGNMVQDETSHTYQYDAENYLVSFDGGVGAIYRYDGEGHRVKKVTNSGSLVVTTIFVYDAMGKMIAEYATNTAGSGTGARYLTADTLGSTRVVTTENTKAVTTQAAANGVVKARYDYLPFGEEIASSYGGRNTISGYTMTDSTRQKFTGYERDGETGLDYAQARYYGNSFGRFTSPDPALSSAKRGVPQSWNRYAYVLNNPLIFVDPSGLEWYYSVEDASHTGVFTPVWFSSNPGSGWELWTKHAGYAYWVSDGKNSHYTVLNPYAEEAKTFGDSYLAASEQLSAWHENHLFHQAVDPIANNTAPIGKAVIAFEVVSLAGGGLGSALIPAGELTTLGIGSTLTESTFVQSLAGRSLVQLTNFLRGTPHDLLQELFNGGAPGAQGARAALANLRIPAGISRETLLVYGEIARRAIENGRDTLGVQAIRLQIIQEALKIVK